MIAWFCVLMAHLVFLLTRIRKYTKNRHSKHDFKNKKKVCCQNKFIFFCCVKAKICFHFSVASFYCCSAFISLERNVGINWWF